MVARIFKTKYNNSETQPIIVNMTSITLNISIVSNSYQKIITGVNNTCHNTDIN